MCGKQISPMTHFFMKHIMCRTKYTLINVLLLLASTWLNLSVRIPERNRGQLHIGVLENNIVKRLFAKV